MAPMLLALLLAAQADAPASYPSCMASPPAAVDGQGGEDQITARVATLRTDIDAARQAGALSKGRAVNLRLKANDVENDLRLRRAASNNHSGSVINSYSVKGLDKRLDAVTAQLCGRR